MATFKTLGALALTSALMCTGAFAQPNIKPGQWDMKILSATGPGFDNAEVAAKLKEMDSFLKQLPAADRKAIEAQLKGRMPTAQGAMPICITPADLAGGGLPMGNDKCQSSNVKKTAKSWSADLVCSKPASKGSVELTFDSANSYRLKSQAVTTDGKNQKLAADMQFTFVKAQCDDNIARSKKGRDY